MELNPRRRTSVCFEAAVDHPISASTDISCFSAPDGMAIIPFAIAPSKAAFQSLLPSGAHLSLQLLMNPDGPAPAPLAVEVAPINAKPNHIHERGSHSQRKRRAVKFHDWEREVEAILNHFMPHVG